LENCNIIDYTIPGYVRSR